MEFLTFTGRAGRLEYLAFAVGGSMLHSINFVLFVENDAFNGPTLRSPLFFVGFVLATLMTWSAAIRRCHDIGRSGFFLLWQLVPLFGIAAALFVIFARGDDMKNRFGPPPWSVTNRAEKRQQLERAALAASIARQPNPEEAWVTDDGSFDMNGLYNDSNIPR